MLLVDHFRKVLQAQLISVLELAKLVSLLLNCIVCQMNERVSDVVECVLTTARPDVPVLIAVALKTAIDARAEAKAAEVKLALMHEQRVVNVLLNYKCAVAIFFQGPPNNLLNFAQSLHDSDALPAIRILTRLDDPGVLRSTMLLANLLDRILVIRVDLASILVVAFLLVSLFFVRLILLDFSFDLLLRLFVLLLDRLVIIDELVILRILGAVLCMEGQWQNFERVEPQ